MGLERHPPQRTLATPVAATTFHTLGDSVDEVEEGGAECLIEGEGECRQHVYTASPNMMLDSYARSQCRLTPH